MSASILSWKFLIPLCLIFFITKIIMVCSQCHGDQSSVLLQLKKELEFQSSASKKLVTWDDKANCCRWGGVTCTNGLVTGLDLSGESISGGINSSSILVSLQHLRSLNLAYNNFYNMQVPFSLGGLWNLVHLNLSNAGFSGQIPREISLLKGLVILDLSSFSFLGTPMLSLENPNFRTFIRNFSELSELYMDGVNISANGDEWCEALSASLPKLRVLSLSDCNLLGPINSSLLKLQSLSTINLSNNNLSTEVPEFLTNFSQLTSLSIAHSQLFGNFPQTILQVPSLQVLDISDNPLLTGSLPEFPQDGSLQTLLLFHTGFSGSLPYSIGKLKMLSIIDLKNCNLSGRIPNSITKLEQLVHVDSSMNRFTGQLPSFSMAKNLSQLVLSHNLLDGPISTTDWHGLSKLKILDLHNNSLNGSIPLSLLQNPSLQIIRLSNNQLNGQLHQIPNGPFRLLHTLDLSSNKLSGQIPVEVFRIQGLKDLILSFNQFSGMLPIYMIQHLKNLSRLDLSYNNLSVNTDGISSTISFPLMSTLKLASCRLKKFPLFIENQSKLTYLDLSDNQIQGAVPKWLWNLSNLGHLNLSHNFLQNANAPLQNISLPLSVLDLHSNLLQGPIPELVNAIYLDYSSNNLSSSIPDEIGDYLSFALFFSLANNNIRGEIPASICKGNYLQVIDLSNNSMVGKIPECLIAEIYTLQVLDLKENHFSGEIPDMFTKNCSLRTLDLSKNMLEGNIPHSLGSCKALEVLNIGENNLSDVFPNWLMDISTLRVLVLRSNNFHGFIECPESNITWPMLQIIDLSANNFSGKLPKGCFKTWKGMMVDEAQSQLQLNHLKHVFLALTGLYYQDSVTVTSKGLEMQLIKILTIFTSIDLSGNKFEGPIPDEIGKFKSLHVLNLSHNSLTGQIPRSLGNMKDLESLDLSVNSLNGTIPIEIGTLNFLSFLNVSYNKLVGRIPIGSQFQSLPADSFEGNPGLCGIPLIRDCVTTFESTNPFLPTSEGENTWMIVATVTGYVIGLGFVMQFLVLWSKWRISYFKALDGIIYKIIPQLDQSNRSKEPVIPFGPRVERRH